MNCGGHRYTVHATVHTAAPRPVKERDSEAFISRFADTLGISERAVRTVLQHVGGNLAILEHLRLSELAALQLRRDEAEKIFSFVQRAQAHLRKPTPSYDRYRENSSPDAFLSLYHEHLAKSQSALWWQRPCLELGTKSPLRRLLNWLGF